MVDPLTFLALIATIAGGTFFLNMVITMNIPARKRRKKREEDEEDELTSSAIVDYFHLGMVIVDQKKFRAIYNSRTV